RERKAEHDLGPVGDPLHERIDRYDRERRDSGRDRKAVELYEDDEAEERLRHQEYGGLSDAHLAGRDRPRAGALDLAVEIAVDDVVPGAAGAAQRERADEDQDEVGGARAALVSGNRRQARRPPARNKQEPGADRPVEPGEA